MLFSAFVAWLDAVLGSTASLGFTSGSPASSLSAACAAAFAFAFSGSVPAAKVGAAASRPAMSNSEFGFMLASFSRTVAASIASARHMPARKIPDSVFARVECTSAYASAYDRVRPPSPLVQRRQPHGLRMASGAPHAWLNQPARRRVGIPTSGGIHVTLH